MSTHRAPKIARDWYLSRNDIETESGGQVAFGPATHFEIRERLWQTNETDGGALTLGCWTAMAWDAAEIECFGIKVLPFTRWGAASGYQQVPVGMRP